MVGPGVAHVEHAGEPVTEVGGRAVDEPVDRPHAELLVGELHHEGHDRRGAVVVRRTFAAVVRRGLEAVVTVGQDHGGRGDRGADGCDHRGVGEAPQLVGDAFGVGRPWPAAPRRAAGAR